MKTFLNIDRVTPEQLAEEIGCSPRHVRKVARELGACRIFGKTMFLLPDDVKAILEASRPQPLLSSARPPLPAVDYEDLKALLEKRSEKRSRGSR